VHILRFRVPGRPLAAATLLSWVVPELSTGERSALLQAGALSVARIEGRHWKAARPVGGRRELQPGMPLRLEAARLTPDPPPPEAWLAHLPELPWPRGEGSLGDGDAARFRFETRAVRGGISRVAVTAAPADFDAVRAWFADAGTPLLGDRRYGGIALPGPPLWLADGTGEDDAWPAEPAFAEGLSVLRVSRATARALERGHPWVLADAETGDTGAVPAGAVVRLEAGRRSLGLARVEADAELAARVWALGAERPRDAESVEGRVAAALRRRAGLRARLAEEGTDALRLIHGEADALPGLAVDRLGPILRMLVTGRAAWPIRERVLRALQHQLAAELGPEPPGVEVVHLRRPPAGQLVSVRAIGDGAPEELVVNEAGLRLRVATGLGDPTRPRPGTGLFLDQRANRARIAKRVRPGGVYLNLFAHTGTFSARMLAAGAGHVTSVDLSAPYLAWLEDNLALSELPSARHRSVRRDARRVLDELPGDARFDGIVLDPPTAAAAGRRHWDVERGLGPLVAAALGRLVGGGWLLLSRNDRRRGRLPAMVREQAARSGVEIARIEAAPPSEDFASPAPFPEGAAFEGIVATIR
jgi:23S rRNA (cytosine1962-C5)-methyltransferase